MSSLTPEQITALLGTTRTKGQYSTRLGQFIQSGEGGVCVQENWAADFAEKNPSTVKQGFENAKNSKNAPEGATEVQVILHEDKVYLINKAVATA